MLDIDELYSRMTARGIRMIDTIQGPPRWDGPDVLLRQTSFRALAEPRRMREPDGSLVDRSLAVRFGEVEARGAALTRTGRDRYDAMLLEVDRRRAAAPEASRQEIAQRVWMESLPATETKLREAGLAYFSYSLGNGNADRASGTHLARHLDTGAVVATPIVYEDFLPRSAAGIFQSNLTAAHDDAGSTVNQELGIARDVGWLADVIETTISDPFDLYEAEQQASEDAVVAALDRR